MIFVILVYSFGSVFLLCILTDYVYFGTLYIKEKQYMKSYI